MTTNQEDKLYVQHHEYNRVISEFDRSIIYPHYDETPLKKVMRDMHTQMHNLNANDKFIKEFFRLIRNDNAYYYGLTKNYCKYVNFWLNDEFMKKGYHITGPEFHVFQTFVKKLNENTGNQNKLCDNYINRLKPEEFKKIDLLHRLYNSYNEIKVTPVTDSIKKCNNLHLLAKNYSEFIDEYYDDNNFYKNLEYIKKLILNITDKDNSPCVDKIYFRTPKKVIEIQEAERRAREEETARKALEEEKARKALEEEKARKALEEEAERRARVEALDNQKAEMEQRVQSLRGNTEQLQLLRNNPLYGTSMEKSLSLSTDDSRVLQTPEGTLRHQTEENILQREEGYAQNDASRTTGTFGGSTGFPGYITEVLGSVEPGPVLGVSGGMGALFLLFKYTPFGSFFGGRRRRMHQIPRTFGGFPPGEFPNFHEYDGGFIGYAPMNINPLAE